MDKNAIKKYAVWARRELISRVSQKALQYGITEKNMVDAGADSVNGQDTTLIEHLVKSCIELCVLDWDSFETSWDFKRHPLIQFRVPAAAWGDEKPKFTIQAAYIGVNFSPQILKPSSATKRNSTVSSLTSTACRTNSRRKKTTKT